MSGILDAIQISSRGLSVQRQKMNVVAQNIANAETTETAKGGPYRRQRVQVSETKERGGFSSIMNKAQAKLTRTNPNHIRGHTKKVGTREEVSAVDSKIVTDSADSFKLVFDPSHPNADEKGYVKMPNIEVVTEMVDMMAASRAYEANTVAISVAKDMTEKALDI